MVVIIPLSCSAMYRNISVEVLSLYRFLRTSASFAKSIKNLCDLSKFAAMRSIFAIFSVKSI